MSISMTDDGYEILLESYGQEEKGSITIKNKNIDEIFNTFKQLVKYGNDDNIWYGKIIN